MTMPDTPITIVVAVAHMHIVNRRKYTGIIGKDNALPWRIIPEDMRHFRKITMGGALIMGRRTFDSIGRPLPGRTNIVVSRKSKNIEGCKTAHSPQAALDIARKSGKEIFIIGGEQIYRQMLPIASVICLTELRDIKLSKGGDANFPRLNRREWEISTEEDMQEFNGRFVIYRRIPPSSSIPLISKQTEV